MNLDGDDPVPENINTKAKSFKRELFKVFTTESSPSFLSRTNSSFEQLRTNYIYRNYQYCRHPRCIKNIFMFLPREEYYTWKSDNSDKVDSISRFPKELFNHFNETSEVLDLTDYFNHKSIDYKTHSDYPFSGRISLNTKF